MLDNQKAVFNKTGLGYNPNQNQKYLKNMVSKRIIFVPKTAYYKLDKVSKKYTKYIPMHISQSGKIKRMWIAKKNISVTNPKGCKKTWVPKNIT